MAFESDKGWEWFGRPGHFIAASWCRFHLCTLVDGWLISTVGELLFDEGVREIVAQSRGVQLQGRGDVREADYLEKIGYERMGGTPHRYETMVFDARSGKRCHDSHIAGCVCPPETHKTMEKTMNNEIAQDIRAELGAIERDHRELIEIAKRIAIALECSADVLLRQEEREARQPRKPARE